MFEVGRKRNSDALAPPEGSEASPKRFCGAQGEPSQSFDGVGQHVPHFVTAPFCEPVRAAFVQPTKKSPESIHAAQGATHQTWRQFQQALQKGDGPQRLFVGDVDLFVWRSFVAAIACGPWPYELYENGARVAQFGHTLERIFDPQAILLCEIVINLSDVPVRCFLLNEHCIDCAFVAPEKPPESFVTQLAQLASWLTVKTGRPWHLCTDGP